MWVKRDKRIIKTPSPEERAADRKIKMKQALKIGFYAFTILLAIKIFYFVSDALQSPEGFKSIINRFQLDKILEFLIRMTSLPLIAGLIFFLMRIILPPKLNEDSTTSLMCDKCFKPHTYDADPICECGGNNFPMDYFEWIEEVQEIYIKDMEWIYKYRITKNEG